jgi:hypothetical protein
LSRLRPIFFSLIAMLVAACAGGGQNILAQAELAPVRDPPALEAWITTHPEATAGQKIAVFGALCDAHSRLGRYAEAAKACASALELSASPSTGMRQSATFWAALAGERPLVVRGAVDEPLTYDWAGVPEVRVSVGDETLNWIVDTGAEVSVLSVSVAQRLGARPLRSGIDIAGSTPGVASGGLAMIDRLRIDGAEIENLPVFVLPDEAVKLPPGVLPPVLGAPVLYAFGRVSFSEHGGRLRLGSAATPPGRGAAPIR